MIEKMLIESVIVRMADWPEAAIHELFRAMDKIEKKYDLIYHLSREEEADLRVAIKEADKGLVASEEEMEALFSRYRQRP